MAWIEIPGDPHINLNSCGHYSSDSFERADLVHAHETAVAFNISCEDRDEASADCNRV
jgi:hypothetical protein